MQLSEKFQRQTVDCTGDAMKMTSRRCDGPKMAEGFISSAQNWIYRLLPVHFTLLIPQKREHFPWKFFRLNCLDFSHVTLNFICLSNKWKQPKASLLVFNDIVSDNYIISSTNLIKSCGPFSLLSTRRSALFGFFRHYIKSNVKIFNSSPETSITLSSSVHSFHTFNEIQL